MEARELDKEKRGQTVSVSEGEVSSACSLGVEESAGTEPRVVF